MNGRGFARGVVVSGERSSREHEDRYGSVAIVGHLQILRKCADDHRDGFPAFIGEDSGFLAYVETIRRRAGFPGVEQEPAVDNDVLGHRETRFTAEVVQDVGELFVESAAVEGTCHSSRCDDATCGQDCHRGHDQGDTSSSSNTYLLPNAHRETARTTCGRSNSW